MKTRAQTLHALRERLDVYERLMRLDKPIGTLLLLWPTLWALWFSSFGEPSWVVVWIFALGTLLMRSAGCVINDLADRDVDRLGDLEPADGAPGAVIRLDLSAFDLPVLLPNAAEAAAHEAVLSQLDKASNGQTVWRPAAAAMA